jgi:hypothetical protein
MANNDIPIDGAYWNPSVSGNTVFFGCPAGSAPHTRDHGQVSDVWPGNFQFLGCDPIDKRAPEASGGATMAKLAPPITSAMPGSFGCGWNVPALTFGMHEVGKDKVKYYYATGFCNKGQDPNARPRGAPKSS